MSFEVLKEEEGRVVSKLYSYTYEEYEDEDKGPGTMAEDILADPELAGLKELVIGDWGGAWENSCQERIDAIQL